MTGVKYVLLSKDGKDVIDTTFTPKALGIVARDHPGSVAMIRTGSKPPYSYSWLFTRLLANLEYLQAKEGKT